MMQMHVERFIWPPPDFTSAATFGGQVMGNDPDEEGYKQPEMGVVIGWNRPQARWWQPYVVLSCGVWSVQWGWLYD